MCYHVFVKFINSGAQGNEAIAFLFHTVHILNTFYYPSNHQAPTPSVHLCELHASVSLSSPECADDHTNIHHHIYKLSGLGGARSLTHRFALWDRRFK